MARPWRLAAVALAAAALYILPELGRELFLGTYGLIGWPTYYHTRIARQIVQGQGFPTLEPDADPLSFGGRPWTYPPGFPGLLAISSVATGWDASISAILLPPLMGAAAVPLVYCLARAVGVPPLLAAVLFALSPPQVYTASHAMSRIIPLYESYALLLLLARYLRGGGRAWLAPATVCLAAAWGSHMAVALYACALALALARERPERWRGAALAVACSFALVAFWYLRLYLALGLPEENAFHENFGDLASAFPDLVFERRLTSVSLLVYAASLLAVPVLSRTPEGRALSWWMLLSVALVALVGTRENIHLALPFSLAAAVVLRRLPRTLLVPLLVLSMYYAYDQASFMAVLPPDAPTIDVMRWLANETPPDAVVLSEWSRGHWITSIAHRRDVMDFFAEYVPDADELWWDTRLIFHGENATRTLGLLAEHNVTHILVDAPMRQWEVWGWERYGLLGMLNDTVTFPLVYNSTYAQVYAVNASAAPLRSWVPRVEREGNAWTRLAGALAAAAVALAAGLWWRGGAPPTAALGLLAALVVLPLHIYPVAANTAPLGWDSPFNERLPSLLASQGFLPVNDPLSLGGRLVGIGMGYHVLCALLSPRQVALAAYLALLPLAYALARRIMEPRYAVLAALALALQLPVLRSSTESNPCVLALALVLAHLRWEHPLVLLALSTVHLPSFLFAVQASLLRRLVEEWRAPDAALLALTVPLVVTRLVPVSPLLPLVPLVPFMRTRERRGVLVPLALAMGWLALLSWRGMALNEPTWGYTEPWDYYLYLYGEPGLLLALLALTEAPAWLAALAVYALALTKLQLLTLVPSEFALLPAVPFSLLAAIGLRRLVGLVAAPSRPAVRRGAAAALVLAFAYWSAQAGIGYASGAYSEVTLEDREALAWVRANATGLVLGSVDVAGAWVPTLGNRTSFVDAEFATAPDFARRENVTKHVYGHDDPALVRRLLDAEGIDYVYLTARDPLFVHRGVENVTRKFEQANLTLVFRNERARVFATGGGRRR